MDLHSSLQACRQLAQDFLSLSCLGDLFFHAVERRKSLGWWDNLPSCDLRPGLPFYVRPNYLSTAFRRLHIEILASVTWILSVSLSPQLSSSSLPSSSTPSIRLIIFRATSTFNRLRLFDREGSVNQSLDAMRRASSVSLHMAESATRRRSGCALLIALSRTAR